MLAGAGARALGHNNCPEDHQGGHRRFGHRYGRCDNFAVCVGTLDARHVLYPLPVLLQFERFNFVARLVSRLQFLRSSPSISSEG